MGLDMYLTGSKYFTSHDRDRDKEDGFPVKEHNLELGYWRKHPNLHGYIVETFAKGVDECQDIELSTEDLKKIISAVTEDSLPHTEGFFFGKSDGSEREETLKIFNDALKWLETKEDGVWRSVIYRASW